MGCQGSHCNRLVERGASSGGSGTLSTTTYAIDWCTSTMKDEIGTTMSTSWLPTSTSTLPSTSVLTTSNAGDILSPAPYLLNDALYGFFTKTATSAETLDMPVVDIDSTLFETMPTTEITPTIVVPTSTLRTLINRDQTSLNTTVPTPPTTSSSAIPKKTKEPGETADIQPVNDLWNHLNNDTVYVAFIMPVHNGDDSMVAKFVDRLADEGLVGIFSISGAPAPEDRISSMSRASSNSTAIANISATMRTGPLPANNQYKIITKTFVSTISGIPTSEIKTYTQQPHEVERLGGHGILADEERKYWQEGHWTHNTLPVTTTLTENVESGGQFHTLTITQTLPAESLVNVTLVFTEPWNSAVVTVQEQVWHTSGWMPDRSNRTVPETRTATLPTEIGDSSLFYVTTETFSDVTRTEKGTNTFTTDGVVNTRTWTATDTELWEANPVHHRSHTHRNTSQTTMETLWTWSGGHRFQTVKTMTLPAETPSTTTKTETKSSDGVLTTLTKTETYWRKKHTYTSAGDAVLTATPSTWPFDNVKSAATTPVSSESDRRSSA